MERVIDRSSSGVGAILTILGLLAAATAWGVKPDHRDWLDLRRGGVPAIVADARTQCAPVPWRATYLATLEPEHPLAIAGIATVKLSVTRAPPIPGQPGRTLVRFEEPAALRGFGVLVDGNSAWVRTGPKVVPATAISLGALLPGLQLALGAFVAGEVGADWDLMMEGEFGDTAVLRFKPRYEASAALLPAKAGVSKRYGTWTLGELDDRKGVPISRVEWLDVQLLDGVPVPQALRLHPRGDPKAGVTLERVGLQIGKQVVWRSGPKALK